MTTKIELRVSNQNFCFDEPEQACQWPYPNGYWGRYLTNNMTNEDHDYVYEMMSNPDRISAQHFDRAHQKNTVYMERIKDVWLHDLACSASFKAIESMRDDRGAGFSPLGTIRGRG